MCVGEAGLAIGAAVVVGVGASAIGALGPVVELAAKDIDKNKSPILRTVAEVFSKTLQAGPAAFSLLVLGSFFLNQAGFLALAGIGVVVCLTPTINGIIHHNGNDSLKSAAKVCDKVVSAVAKAVNTTIVTAGMCMAVGMPAGIIGGLSLSALNIIVYRKE